jgi:Fic family protein
MPYIRIEAASSSRIEGTQTSLEELLVREAEEATETGDQAREVVNYVLAMQQGLLRLAELPVSNRLVREAHSTLLTGVRGGRAAPGDFRKVQVYVGPYTPPPPHLVEALMGEWEAFVAQPPTDMPVLVQCAVMHYQFEAIHPFLDGNGRIGRFLITLLLCERKVLAQPLLYLSAYLEAHRSEYYRHLFEVSEEGDWSGWLRFFLNAVLLQAEQAVTCCREIVGLRERLRQDIAKATRSANALSLLDLLFTNPYATVPRTARRLGVTEQTARNLFAVLGDLGIVDETEATSGHARLYRAKTLVDAIKRAAQPPSAEAADACAPI